VVRAYDCGGHDEYKAVSHLFLTDESLLLLPVDVSDPRWEDDDDGKAWLESGILSWLEMIEAKLGEGCLQALVVCTKVDKCGIAKAEGRREDLYRWVFEETGRAGRPGLPGIVNEIMLANAKDPSSYAAIRRQVVELAVGGQSKLSKSVVLRRVPQSYMVMDRMVQRFNHEYGASKPYMQLDELIRQAKAVGVGSSDEAKIDDALRFLANRGSVVLFEDRVFTHPQWITRAFSLLARHNMGEGPPFTKFVETSCCNDPCCGEPFSLTIRRHHCQACGGSACGKHSRQIMKLAENGMRSKERVCDLCRERLDRTRKLHKESEIEAAVTLLQHKAHVEQWLLPRLWQSLRMDDEECDTMRRVLEQKCKALCTIEKARSIDEWLSEVDFMEDADMGVINDCGFDDTEALLQSSTKEFLAALNSCGVEQACKERLLRAFAELQAKRCFLVPAALKDSAPQEIANPHAQRTVQLGRCYR
jgi:hypothetical protein